MMGKGACSTSFVQASSRQLSQVQLVPGCAALVLEKVSLSPREMKSDCGAELSLGVKVLLGFSPCIHLTTEVS